MCYTGPRQRAEARGRWCDEDFDAGGPGQDQPDSGYSGAAYRRLSRHADGDAGRVPGGHRDGGRGGGRLFPADRGHLPSGGEGHFGAAGGGCLFPQAGPPGAGLEVRLAKRVPAYAGLGGGSADVAAVLRCLRTLYAPDLPRQALEEIGLAVGSDVPFCVRGGTCLAEGRGEILTDLPPLPDCAIVLCKPDFGLPTPELFARLDGADLGPRPDTAAMAAALARGDLAAAAACLGNVFERVLTEEEGEEIRSIKEALLRHGALGAAMSGSGPTVFGLFDDRQKAVRAKEALEGRYRQTYLAAPVKILEKME